MEFNEILSKFGNDSHEKIRGFIEIQENGKTIEVAENMITLAGRKAILKKFFGNETADQRPMKLFVDTNKNLTTDATGADMISSPKYAEISYPGNTDDITPNVEIDDTDTGCYVKISGTVDFTLHESDMVVNSIGLCYDGLKSETDTTANLTKLFSRAVINSKTFSHGCKYTINYYIYF